MKSLKSLKDGTRRSAQNIWGGGAVEIDPHFAALEAAFRQKLLHMKAIEGRVAERRNLLRDVASYARRLTEKNRATIGPKLEHARAELRALTARVQSEFAAVGVTPTATAYPICDGSFDLETLGAPRKAAEAAEAASPVVVQGNVNPPKQETLMGRIRRVSSESTGRIRQASSEALTRVAGYISPRPADPPPAPSAFKLWEQAVARANAGDARGALALFRRADAAVPGNAKVAARIAALEAALQLERVELERDQVHRARQDIASAPTTMGGRFVDGVARAAAPAVGMAFGRQVGYRIATRIIPLPGRGGGG